MPAIFFSFLLMIAHNFQTETGGWSSQYLHIAQGGDLGQDGAQFLPYCADTSIFIAHFKFNQRRKLALESHAYRGQFLVLHNNRLQLEAAGNLGKDHRGVNHVPKDAFTWEFRNLDDLGKSIIRFNGTTIAVNQTGHQLKLFPIKTTVSGRSHFTIYSSTDASSLIGRGLCESLTTVASTIPISTAGSKVDSLTIALPSAKAHESSSETKSTKPQVSTSSRLHRHEVPKP